MRSERGGSDGIRSCRRRADGLHGQYRLADFPARGKWEGSLLGPEVVADGLALGQGGIQGVQDASPAGFPRTKSEAGCSGQPRRRRRAA